MHRHEYTAFDAAPSTADMRNEWVPNTRTEATYAKALSDMIDNFQTSTSIAPNASKPLYDGIEFPLYGPQYGLPECFNESKILTPTQPAITRAIISDPYEEMFREADADIQRVYLESLKTSGFFSGDDQSK